MMLHATVALLFAILACAGAFSTTPSSWKRPALARRTTNMHFDEAGSSEGAVANLIPRSRYIASNRFNVRPGKEPTFEARWANRKSRLAKLEGFRFFTLMRKLRVEGGEEDDSANYISYTIWEGKDNFDAWRTGEAFKEAHGGGGIKDFIQLLSTALFILKGKPNPAFYDAILPVESGLTNADLGIEPNAAGWRDVKGDGKEFLPTDVIVAQDRFSVKEESRKDFETVFAERESKLKEHAGFFGFFLQRRDALKADDGVNYIANSMWQSLQHYEDFKSSMLAKAAEGGAAPSKTLALLNAPPKIVLYEGKLALLSPKGP